jgi:predicted Zn-dependent protease
MKKIIFQGIFISFSFFASWFLLSKINWVSILKVQKITDKTEEKIGDVFWDIINKSEDEDTNPFAKNALDSIVSKICLENNFDRELIKIHIVRKDEINAFAMPNGHLLVYTGLIEASENQEELSGVLCHEIAHIQLNHVMKKLIKEVGLSTLISMTSGGGGTEVIKETIKLFTWEPTN